MNIKPTDLKSLLKQSGIKTEFKLRRTTGEVEGISFGIRNIAFKGSQIDRKFSYANLLKIFEENQKIQGQIQGKQQIPDDFDLSKYIPEMSKPVAKIAPPPTSEPKTQTTIQPQIPQESVLPISSGQPQSAMALGHKLPEPPKSIRSNPQVKGVELTGDQNKTLQDGGYIYLENMNKKDGSGKFSAYVFLND